MAVTILGKYLRKLRIDNEQLLKDMAEAIGISSAQLSAMELGNRTIQADFAEKLASQYTGVDHAEVERLVSLSQPSIKTSMNNATDIQRETMVMFARAFKDMSDDQLKTVQDILMKTK